MVGSETLEILERILEQIQRRPACIDKRVLVVKTGPGVLEETKTKGIVKERPFIENQSLYGHKDLEDSRLRWDPHLPYFPDPSVEQAQTDGAV